MHTALAFRDAPQVEALAVYAGTAARIEADLRAEFSEEDAVTLAVLLLPSAPLVLATLGGALCLLG